RTACGGACAVRCADGHVAPGVCQEDGNCSCSATCEGVPTPTPRPHPMPHGRICCQCKDAARACFDFAFVEVQPACPRDCQSFLGAECDSSNTCAPMKPCSDEQDCDDGNGCTTDRCTPEGCTHECVCVGPARCGPGSGNRSHP